MTDSCRTDYADCPRGGVGVHPDSGNLQHATCDPVSKVFDCYWSEMPFKWRLLPPFTRTTRVGKILHPSLWDGYLSNYFF